MGEIGEWRHLCVDMQRMFAEDTPWHVPWMARISPQIEELAGRYPSRTIFTRFVPPQHADAMPGKWRDYYRKWWMMTGEHLPHGLVQLTSSLASHVPPARYFDKRTYSPWIDGRLHTILRSERVDTLVITGGETDVCVLAATLGAIDLGYRVIMLKDAVFSSADDTYDASLELLHDRFSVQLELMETVEFLSGLG
ncbi:cysteine hydrolase [Rhizobium sp. S9]|uniref:cysteine hydrolase family protein n=1 Tax=unclassified Rhizobium TaxID=2613769 RepID=UPI000A211021|nr:MULTISPECIES: isochorismatase family cysteine hydrolase [unclassified Rhizobium]ARO26484.1 isochorismatase-like protein [Rhizobium sp. TAL182]PDS96733.1 cysteine hydrolase [Rhizobium sp. S9]